MTVIIFIYNSLQNIYNIIFLKNRNKTNLVSVFLCYNYLNRTINSKFVEKIGDVSYGF